MRSSRQTTRQTTSSPWSEEAEKSVIGGILYDGSCIEKVKPLLEHDDFYQFAHQRIYSAILDVYETGAQVDLVTVNARLKDLDLISKVGGAHYLSILADSCPSTANIEDHARIVKEKSTARKIMAEAQRIIEVAQDPNIRLEEIPTKLSIETPQKIEINHVSRITTQLKENIQKGYPGLYPCYNLLEKTIRKIAPGHLWIVGAYTSTGKSAFLVDLVCRLYHYGVMNPHIAIFSTEMSSEQYLIRMLSNKTRVPGWAITDNLLTPQQQELIRKAYSFFSSRNLYIYDKLYKYEDIERAAVMLKNTKGLDILCIDYIQNLWGDGTIYERMSKLAPLLQYLAKELELTVIALSQVSNQSVREKGSGVYGYKGAGEIAASADLAIDLERDPDDLIKFIVAKNRHGKREKGMLEFTDNFTRLREVTEEDHVH